MDESPLTPRRTPITTKAARETYIRLWKQRKDREEDRPAPTCREFGQALGVSAMAGKNWIDKLIDGKFLIHTEPGAHRATKPVDVRE